MKHFLGMRAGTEYRDYEHLDKAVRDINDINLNRVTDPMRPLLAF